MIFLSPIDMLHVAVLARDLCFEDVVVRLFRRADHAHARLEHVPLEQRVRLDAVVPPVRLAHRIRGVPLSFWDHEPSEARAGRHARPEEAHIDGQVLAVERELCDGREGATGN